MADPNPFLVGMLTELEKSGRKVVHFAEKDVPAKAKKIYGAMKRDMPELRERYGGRAKEVAARTALKKGGSALEVLKEHLKTAK